MFQRHGYYSPLPPAFIICLWFLLLSLLALPQLEKLTSERFNILHREWAWCRQGGAETEEDQPRERASVLELIIHKAPRNSFYIYGSRIPRELPKWVLQSYLIDSFIHQFQSTEYVKIKCQRSQGARCCPAERSLRSAPGPLKHPGRGVQDELIKCSVSSKFLVQWDCLRKCDASILCRGTCKGFTEMKPMELGPANEKWRPPRGELKEQYC